MFLPLFPAKDKERYKLEVMDLKTKISLCCRGDHDARETETGEKKFAKLARQLQDMEERLIKTQEQLEETVYEKDNLKAKVRALILSSEFICFPFFQL